MENLIISIFGGILSFLESFIMSALSYILLSDTRNEIILSDEIV